VHYSYHGNYCCAAYNRPAEDLVLTRVLATSPRAAPAVLRLALGAIIFPHGAQHALGWFGGYGFGGTLGWMTGTLGFPAPLAALAIVTELVAPVLLVVGLGGRAAAAGLFALMVGAAGTHTGNGFFMNWFGALPPGAEGFEYHLLVMAIAAAVMAEGSGAYSLDSWLAARRSRRRTSFQAEGVAPA
jgi:putative oxidoreductase